MNRTKEQTRKAVFGKLQSLRRKLLACGIPCHYARSVLSHKDGGSGFTISCRVADDQATVLPQVSVRTPEGTQEFDHLTIDQGLARLKQLFQTGGGTSDQVSVNNVEANGHDGIGS